MLAAIGALLAIAGVGNVLTGMAERWIPFDNPFVVVTTYAVGMAIFTMIMGNAFAAFPVMTAGIGLPLIVQRFGGDPTIMAAVGMLSGFRGTPMTPTGAKLNNLPPALLGRPHTNTVIKNDSPHSPNVLPASPLPLYFSV